MWVLKKINEKASRLYCSLKETYLILNLKKELVSILKSSELPGFQFYTSHLKNNTSKKIFEYISSRVSEKNEKQAKQEHEDFLYLPISEILNSAKRVHLL